MKKIDLENMNKDTESVINNAVQCIKADTSGIITPQLVESLCKGDEDAFQKIYRHNYDNLKDFLTRLLNSSEDAEEVIQDIFLYILENRDKIDPSKNFRHYLYRASRNAAFGMMRRRRKDEKYSNYRINIPETFEASPDELIATKEMSLFISMYVKNLPSQRKRIFEMSRDEGKSVNEIAAELKISPSTVRSQIQSAVNGLRELLTLFAILFIS